MHIFPANLPATTDLRSLAATIKARCICEQVHQRSRDQVPIWRRCSFADKFLVWERLLRVRQAVAVYGYAAAKQHALEHYSKEEVEAADRCVRGSDLQGAQQRVDTRSGRTDAAASCRDRSGGCSR